MAEYTDDPFSDDNIREMATKLAPSAPLSGRMPPARNLKAVDKRPEQPNFRVVSDGLERIEKSLAEVTNKAANLRLALTGEEYSYKADSGSGPSDSSSQLSVWSVLAAQALTIARLVAEVDAMLDASNATVER